MAAEIEIINVAADANVGGKVCPFLDRFCSRNCRAFSIDEEGKDFCDRLVLEFQKLEAIKPSYRPDMVGVPGGIYG